MINLQKQLIGNLLKSIGKKNYFLLKIS